MFLDQLLPIRYRLLKKPIQLHNHKNTSQQKQIRWHCKKNQTALNKFRIPNNCFFLRFKLGLCP